MLSFFFFFFLLKSVDLQLPSVPLQQQLDTRRPPLAAQARGPSPTGRTALRHSTVARHPHAPTIAHLPLSRPPHCPPRVGAKTQGGLQASSNRVPKDCAGSCDKPRLCFVHFSHPNIRIVSGRTVGPISATRYRCSRRPRRTTPSHRNSGCPGTRRIKQGEGMASSVGRLQRVALLTIPLSEHWPADAPSVHLCTCPPPPPPMLCRAPAVLAPCKRPSQFANTETQRPRDMRRNCNQSSAATDHCFPSIVATEMGQWCFPF